MHIGVKRTEPAQEITYNTKSDRRRRTRLALPGLRMKISERRVLLFVIDTLLLNLALLVAVRLAFDFPLTLAAVSANIKWFVTLTVVCFFTAVFFDCYNLARAASAYHSARSSLLAVFSAVFIYSLIPVLTPPLHTRTYLFIFGGLAAIAVLSWRVLYARLFVQPWFVQRALVVGAGNAGRTLAEALAQHPDDANPFRGTGYTLVGFVDDNPGYHGVAFNGIPVLGGRDRLVALAQQQQVDEIVLAITHRHSIASELFDAVLRCRELGFRITTMPVLYERLLGRVPVEHIGRDLQMVVPMDDDAGERLYLFAKRGVDLGLSLVSLLGLGLLIPIVALANVLTSPGPLFYRQVRVGLGGRPFTMIKFRSMIPDAECNGEAVWACADDTRISWIGHFLRKTRLDELPQVFNVLKGEMSIIGPRPERPEFVEQLARVLPFYRARHALRPGITGWAQVQFDYGNSVDDARTKLEYDLYYIKHASLLLDARILLRTGSVMALMKGM